MHLSPEEIAAAEACGVNFLPASAAQVQRLSMQRKVFYRAGAPILATRGDGLFETVGTLQQLIEEGRQQQRDLSQWLEAAKPEATAKTVVEVGGPAALPETAEAAPVPAPLEPTPLLEAEPVIAKAAPPPKRPRQKRPRLEPAVPELLPFDVAAPELPAEGPVVAAAATGAAEPLWEAEKTETVITPLSPVPARAFGRSAAREPAAVAETPGQDRGKRWLMAGAARRGRAGKHWSTRQR